MRAVRSTGVSRRGLLALVLAVLALVLAPGAPAASPSPVPASWTASWTDGWTAGRPDDPGRRYVAGVPLALGIPRLGVATAVVAVNADAGVLAPPADPALVGWWAGGARPGSPDGAVVMTGHTVHSGGGVFDELAVLEPDDLVQVTTARSTLRYAVVTVRELTKDQLASTAGELFAVSGRPRLVLVTCTDWDDGEYLGNTVVVGVPIDPAGRS